MPTMMEIYEQYADGYDELVKYEDHESNLPNTLFSLADWDGSLVVEAGAGTGRVTAWYAPKAARIIVLDRSDHMLSRLQKNCAPWLSKIKIHQADNLTFPEGDGNADIFIEGWSFGHSVGDYSGTIAEATSILVDKALSTVKPGGKVIFIETLGSNSDTPTAPGNVLPQFYHLLEEEHGFVRKEISTDYCFPSNEMATRVMSFFFGAEFGIGVKKRGTAIIPEWTGIWSRSR